MKIVHVVPGVTPEWGGLAAACLGLAGALTRAGHEVHVVAGGSGGEPVLPAPVQLWRVAVHRAGGRFLIAPGLAAVLRRVGAGASVLHVHGLWTFANLAAYRVARHLGVRLFVAPHGMLAPWALARRAWKKRVYGAVVERPALNSAHGVHVLTAAEAQDVRAFGIEAPLWQVPNGVDPSAGGVTVARGPERGGALRVTYLGRLEHHKGLLRLVDALQRVRRRGLPVNLVVAGPDTGRVCGRIRWTARRLGVAAAVCIVGPMVGRARMDLLHASDLFVLPSLRESFSLALLEAMASGCPVVATEGVAAPSVREAGAGLVVPGDPQSLAAAIEALLRAPAWRLACGRRAARYAHSRYSWERAAQCLVSAYAGRGAAGGEVLAGSSAPGLERPPPRPEREALAVSGPGGGAAPLAGRAAWTAGR